MGQYASGTARDRIEQAQLLFRLHPDIDRDYLDRRIRDDKRGRVWRRRFINAAVAIGWVRTDHAEFAARLTERRAALGNAELPRNAGNNRTESKRALLAAIEAAGGRW